MGGSRRRQRGGRPHSEGRGDRPRRRTPDRGPSGGPGTRGGSQVRLGELAELSPLSLFCTLYLGVTETNGYAEVSPSRVKRQFQLSDEELEAYLQEHRMAEVHLSEAGFDLESARYDIKVAPEGISRLELARTLFEEFQSG